MGASVESLAMRGQVRRTKKLKQTTANINISKRVLRLKVVNDIVHRRGKSHEKVASVTSIGLEVLKEMAIRRLVIGTSTAISSLCVLLFVRGDVVCKYIGILHLGREEGLNCVVKCGRIP